MSKNETAKASAGASVEDEVRASLERSVQKIDLSRAVSGGATVTPKMCRKALRLIHEHAADAVSAVQMLANFDNGAAPYQQPSGLRMIFDASKGPVIAETFPVESMYAATMAYRVPTAALEGSMLEVDGPTVHTSELVGKIEALGDAIHGSSTAIADGYTGLFSHERRDAEGYAHEYWAVTRSVVPSLNVELADAIAAADRDDTQTLQSVLHETRALRHETAKKQSAARADKISALLGAVGVQVSKERILGSSRSALIENTFNNIVANEDCSKAALYSNAVALTDSALSSGVVLSDTLRLGPSIVRGASLARGKVSLDAVDAFPASVPCSVSPWKLGASGSAPESLKVDAKCTRGVPNSPYTWAAEREQHLLLAKNLYYNSRSNEWSAYQTKSGFDNAKSVSLRPLAVHMD
jgi:hypothetical protein